MVNSCCLILHKVKQYQYLRCKDNEKGDRRPATDGQSLLSLFVSRILQNDKVGYIVSRSRSLDAGCVDSCVSAIRYHLLLRAYRVHKRRTSPSAERNYSFRRRGNDAGTPVRCAALMCVGGVHVIKRARVRTPTMPTTVTIIPKKRRTTM